MHSYHLSEIPNTYIKVHIFKYSGIKFDKIFLGYLLIVVAILNKARVCSIIDKSVLPESSVFEWIMHTISSRAYRVVNTVREH